MYSLCSIQRGGVQLGSDEQIPYDWNGTKISHADHVKFLGILIEEKLNFKMLAQAAATKGLKVLSLATASPAPHSGPPTSMSNGSMRAL